MTTQRKSLKVSEESYEGYSAAAKELGVPISALAEALGVFMASDWWRDPPDEPINEVRLLAQEIAWKRRMRQD